MWIGIRGQSAAQQRQVSGRTEAAAKQARIQIVLDRVHPIAKTVVADVLLSLPCSPEWRPSLTLPCSPSAHPLVASSLCTGETATAFDAPSHICAIVLPPIHATPRDNAGGRPAGADSKAGRSRQLTR
jgi:hypothetical protein